MDESDKDTNHKRPIYSNPINRMTYRQHDNYVVPRLVNIQRSTIKMCALGQGLLKEGRLLESTNIHCWWCRHQFDNVPIGLPLRKHNHPSTDLDEGYSPVCFEVEGVFCSFCCALAYCNEQTSIHYKDSRGLLYELQYDMFGTTHTITPAQDWRYLKAYGGKLTIDKFREKFNKEIKDLYSQSENFAHIVIQVPSSRFIVKTS